MSKEKLIRDIKMANTAYAKGMSYLTDPEYDELWKKLYKVAPHHPVLYHTAQDPNTAFDIYPHAYPIKGTQKAFNMEDLKPFLTRFGSADLILEPKYDGCAAVLYRQDNDQFKLLLEGDGEKGRDITHHLHAISHYFVPKSIESVEVIIHKKIWEDSYGKNIRNTVAGWLNSKQIEITDALELVPHNKGILCYYYEFDGNLLSLYDLLLTLYNDWSKSYPLDGIMIKVLVPKLRLIAGHNGSAYNWSIAWKPPIQCSWTTITDIEWNVSRSGRLIPTIIYNPVELCNTTNTRVTGNNAKWLKDNELAIGDSILVGKAGEIIPKIIDSKIKYGDNPTPTKCPVCNELLQSSGVDLVCNGSNCIVKLTKSISYYYSDKGMDLKGIGPNTCLKLIQDPIIRAVLITSPWALLDPTSYKIKDQMKAILGETKMAEYTKNLTYLYAVKTPAHFVAALGKKGLAYKSAIKLFHYLHGHKLASSVSTKATENFTKAIIKYYTALKEMKNFSFGPIPQPAKITYCITGKISCSRNDMIDYLTKYDWQFSNQVSKQTNILIIGNDPGRTKTTKAKELDIPTINEFELSTMLKENQ